MAQFNAYQDNPFMAQQMQPMQMQQMQRQPMVNNQNTNIFWVQGIEGAKAYPVAPGCVVSLWDTEKNVVYVKFVDAAGVPQPIRILDYEERVESQELSGDKGYVTEEKLNEILDEKFASFAQSLKAKPNKKYNNQKGGRNHGESAV